jgi:hypothetical protein
MQSAFARLGAKHCNRGFRAVLGRRQHECDLERARLPDLTSGE